MFVIVCELIDVHMKWDVRGGGNSKLGKDHEVKVGSHKGSTRSNEEETKPIKTIN